MTHGEPPYPDTVLEFQTRPPFSVDLRRPVDLATLAWLRDAGLGEPFAIVTACNPGGAQLDEKENRVQTGNLEASLRAGGLAIIHVDGCSPDRTHREPEFAVLLPLEDALALALHFGQDALFWFDGERFWLVAGDGSREPLPPPRGE